MNDHRLSGGGHADKVAARGTHATFVGSIRQLILQIRSLLRAGGLGRLSMHGVIMAIVRRISMAMMRLWLNRGLQGRMVDAFAAILHRCGSKALHGQSQHHEPEQERAKSRHKLLIL